MQRILVALLVVLGLLVAGCRGGGIALKANAGSDVTVAVGEQPKFDACASTGNIVNYKWTILKAPEGEMAGDAGKVIRETDANCSFTLDETMALKYLGAWEIQLEVRDAAGNTSTDTFILTVK
ncbi:MAG: hypothetical protein HY260_01570 [Chloroflexi bacterium]|nr:hypothetical protein [Chloroflexota bacterium]